MIHRLAIWSVVVATVLVAAAYASAFLPAGAPAWSSWAFVVGTATMMTGMMALGATSGGRGRGDERGPGVMAWVAIAFTFFVLVACFALAIVHPVPAAGDRLWLGLPAGAAAVLYGVGLLPLLVLPLAYAFSFEDGSLGEEELRRLRALATSGAGAGAPAGGEGVGGEGVAVGKPGAVGKSGAGAPPQVQDAPSAPQQQHQNTANVAVPAPAPAPAAAEQPTAAATGERPRSSPLARRLASERGLDLGTIQGSGPSGRIVRRDVESAVVAAPRAAATAAASAATREGDYTDIQLTQMRKTIARRLGESIGPIPTFYLTAEFDMGRVAEMRGAMAEMGKEFKVSFNDIVLKAVAVALSQHPEVNAQWLGDRIRQFNRVHLGMAVAIDDGLITPVIFDADRKRLSEISAEARELAGRARERKLKPEEFTGSTFSVSNLGMFGIDQFTAIINPPEAGILAIGAVEDKPVVHEGELQIRKRMRVTMSCDHRVIDGALGARFLQTLRRLIENPLMLIY